MIGHLPPYALSRSNFPFPGLASQVGRAGLGGVREGLLASLVVARLCLSILPPYDVSFEDAATRATLAKNWLSGLTLGAALRPALVAVIEAAGLIDHAGSAAALEKLLGNAAASLDNGSREDIEKLIATLRGSR